MEEISFTNTESLIRSIQSEIDNADSETETIINRQRVSRYWNIGLNLRQFINTNKDRNDYENYLIPHLVSRLPVGERTLYFSLRFYDDYPESQLIPPNLSWTHIKLLQRISSPEQRTEYQKRVSKENLSSRELQTLISAIPTEKPTPGGRLKINPASLYTYRIQTIMNKNALDLGFSIFSHNFSHQLESSNTKTLVKVAKKKDEYTFKPSDSDSKALYTYKASLVRIIDGDTLVADIDLGFHTITRQKLRLHSINAYEIDTPKGIKAKQFVETELNPLKFIMIKSYKRDKYSRFLADIFYSPILNNPEEILQSGIFLNQRLIDVGLAVKYYR